MSDTPALRLELNELLRDIPANRDRIFLAMRDLALCKARRFHFRNIQDTEDVVSQSVLYVMGRLHRYDPDRHAACAYFGLMLHRYMLRIVRNMKDQYMIHDDITGEPHDDSVLDSAPTQKLPRAMAGRWRNTQIRDTQERNRVKDVLDEALENACALANTVDGEEAEHAQLAIGVLQHVRKALLGRFNRIEADQRRDAAP
ncbi:MAG: hypothetical protein M0Z50_02545 [Planctomycetia bacterium]|nr:hypothetical protein [Planctomycetia bacterium]